MELLTVSDEALRQAADVLRLGGLAAFPTETVYGLGADTFNADAIARVFEVKGRPRFDPLIIHIAAIETLEKIADCSLLDTVAHERLSVLTEKLWPGPLTIILPKQDCVPGIATSGLPTAAVRLPAHEAAQQLIALSGGALAAPSANLFGRISPTTAEHVREQLGETIDIILDGGPTQVGLESTVLDIRGRRPRILRPGGTPKEAIEALIGPVAGGGEGAAGGGDIVSPGQLKTHYAPRRPLVVYSRDAADIGGIDDADAVLFFDGHSRDRWLASRPSRAASVIRTLSETGNMREAAARLFEMMHELDNSGAGRIHAQLAPEDGLGAAINDRLRRAGLENTVR